MTEHDTLLGRREALKKGALATSALVIGSTAATGTAAAGIGEGRVGHYPMNNIRPDGTVQDASPEGNDGTNNGASVVRGGGKVGNAFNFDGTDARVSIDSFTDLSGGPVTIAAWAYPQSPPKDFSNVLNLADKFGNSRTNSVLIQHRGRESDNPFAYYAADGDGGLANVDSGSISPGSWYHVALSQDGSNLRAYLSGNELPGSPVSVNDYIDVETNVARIAQNAISKDVTFYNAKIDEVRIYDRVLSDSEIRSLAAMGGNSGGNGRGQGRGP